MVSLDDSAVRTHRSHVAWLVKEPEPFPFRHKISHVFRRVEQLLYTRLGTSRVDRNKTAYCGTDTGGENNKLQEATHRAFLRERSKGLCGLFGWSQAETPGKWAKLSQLIPNPLDFRYLSHPEAGTDASVRSQEGARNGCRRTLR